MTAQVAAIRFVPRQEDESWSPGWAPALTFGDTNDTTSWEDLPETEFLFHRFRADADLTIAGKDFSTTYIPVLDFALAWSWVPLGLESEPRVETAMSVVGLTYRFTRRGEQIDIASSDHPEDTTITRSELATLVDEIVSGAFGLLYNAHPQLRQNHYLNDLRRRLGLA